MSPHRKKQSLLPVPLPCLRCGDLSVPVNVALGFSPRDVIPCMHCDALHYLALYFIGDRLHVCYQRYTQRYPLEEYDGSDPHIIICHSRKGSKEPDTFSGPITVFPRKRFKPDEVRQVWRASGRRCHICGKKWRLKDRSRTGWHIDHVIPHIGGGADTEEMPNFRVACAKCNLSKGRGYTEKQVKLGIRRLIEELY